MSIVIAKMTFILLYVLSTREKLCTSVARAKNNFDN